MTGDETTKTRKKYDRYSYFYDFFESFGEVMVFKRWRKDLLSKLEGKILEVGVGTGKNLPFYNQNAKVTAIELSPKMLKKAIDKAKKLKRDYRLFNMDAQDMSFPDESFDYIVSTFVLCSVPDPIKTLREMKRLLKKDGKIMMLEHFLSKNKVIALWQHLHNPITRGIFGFNVNRNTPQNIENVGLKIVHDEYLALKDIFRKIICKRPSTPLQKHLNS